MLSRPFLIRIASFAGLIAAVALVAFGWALVREPASRARPCAFMTLALTQVFHLGNARSRDEVLSPARALANPVAVGAVLIAVVLQLVPFLFEPLARTLNVVSLSPEAWLVVLSLVAVPAVTGQGLKIVRRA